MTQDFSYDANRALIKELMEALEEQSFWVDGALRCQSWNWNDDQREAAESSAAVARAALAKAKAVIE